ncbi:hypothetical protein CONPUDRAFT_129444 [Coniophora puteana RWD-64-598 SS2]|uniref:Cell morphogenesis protein n=1 Tax=Coniophora puteana (strain RWD-64-598) TaxID=741705 RepID=A0A5M3MD74_CONPW|nr:uncharacterized protein CONPUDRAFT_129444 [Coniophora puteana RWD-64-598 SS2]EIW77202.1 hypothetical protein CONPUDRAFT_129444 [Coniophora puteana RWD-64-598 SS2]
MGSEGIQITIPDFDNDDYSSTPIPFGRPTFGAFGQGGSPFGAAGSAFGNAGSGFGPGSDSPTALTPTPFSERNDKSYFHARGDSTASIESTQSKFTPKPFSHAPQPSVATTSSTPFTKKSSFASIRNAFKTGARNVEAPPPLPSLDNNPILKNPFNRSTSSLNQTTKSSYASSPPIRPPTPSNDSRSRVPTRARGHTTIKSQHSHNGSLFHFSDTGSDSGHGFPFSSSSPPPVPRMPGQFAGSVRSESPMLGDEDEAPVQGPKTPSEYALHAVFIRFAATAEGKVDAFLRESLDFEPLLTDVFGPGIDPKFDDHLKSLGMIAQKNAKPVIDSVMRFRRSHNENVSKEILTFHYSKYPSSARIARGMEPAAALNERKSLAYIYIMCRTLVSVLQMLSKDALGDSIGYRLEETTFEQFRKPDIHLLSQSENHRINAELYATMLGHLANIRFVSVTDRFLSELAPVSSGQVLKDLDAKYESLVKGMRYVPLKVWPPEAFEEGAEFMESVAKAFENTHGLRFKIAFAETLTRLLHGIGKTAQAEVNHPQWEKAIEKIHPRAKDMTTKPRYWQAAYPLAVTALCVAPHQFFLKNWSNAVDASFARTKLQEKIFRIYSMNGIMRIIWTYLYRCQEPASTTASKLDTILKTFFPSRGTFLFPYEEFLDSFVCIVHFILSRHFDFGKDFCLELVQENALKSATSSAALAALAPERLEIAVNAILLTLHTLERDEPTPTWPSGSDFSSTQLGNDYPTSSEFMSPALLAKPGIQDFSDRFGAAISRIAQLSFASVGKMSIFDDQWALARWNPAYDETHIMITRHHKDISVTYPSNYLPQISLLQTCFQSWPRCLHPSLPLQDAIDMLISGTIHVEPRIGEVARAALRRFMNEPKHARAVLRQFTKFLFDPSVIMRESTTSRVVGEHARLLTQWGLGVETWLKEILSSGIADEDAEATIALCNDISAGCLFLLAHESQSVRNSGVKVLRQLKPVSTKLPGELAFSRHSFVVLVESLHENISNASYLQGYDDFLDRAELDRLTQWRHSSQDDVLLRIADSALEKDRAIWRHVFPSFMQSCTQNGFKSVMDCRNTLEAAASRFHPFMLSLAGLSTRAPNGIGRQLFTAEREGYKLIKENLATLDQWHMWIKILCATAVISDNRVAMAHAGREHARAPSDITNFERERMTTTRCLFRLLTPFLDSEYTPFRDIAVQCIGYFPAGAYPQLLEDLNLFAFRQFYDDARLKMNGQSVAVLRTRRQARLHSAVARIYFITADLLQLQKSSAKQDALSHALKFVRNTQLFLTSPDNRDSYALQRLRRYFCGLVERLFDGLASLSDSDRFIPANMHLTLYRLCEEWCQYGNQAENVKQRFIRMQRASIAAANDPQAESDSAERFQHETKLLSNASVGALAALCQKAYYQPEAIETGSPTEKSVQDYVRPLQASEVLHRIESISSSAHPQAREQAKKALRSLLLSSRLESTLLHEALRRAFVTQRVHDDHADILQSTGALFLECVTENATSMPEETFDFAKLACLGLSNLCHPLFEIRRMAFNLLSVVHERSAGVLSIAECESLIGSSIPSVYLRAPQLITECFAGEHSSKAVEILAEVSEWLVPISGSGHSRVSLVLLQSLEAWVPSITLRTEVVDDDVVVVGQGTTVLYHLISITKRFGDSNPDQVATIWSRFVEPPHDRNAVNTVLFLVNEAQKVSTSSFTRCCAAIVGCLSRTAMWGEVFIQLCTILDPERTLPSYEHKLGELPPSERELLSDLDLLFADEQSSKLLLGPAEYALLCMSEVAVDRQWICFDQLPVLLQLIFVHLGHRVPFVRTQVRRMLFQLIRSCILVSTDSPERADMSNRTKAMSALAQLESQGEDLFWGDDDLSDISETKVRSLCSEAMNILDPLLPDLRRRLGTTAVVYGTTCLFRHMASRSLQVYRALSVPMTEDGMGRLLGRLSGTIQSSDPNAYSFATEIILTFNASLMCGELDKSFLPRLFWAAAGCLSVTIESVFAAAVQLFSTIIKELDINKPQIVQLITAQRPSPWDTELTIQACLMTGLRSDVTVWATFDVLRSLAKVESSTLIDNSQTRLRDLFTVAVPWCMHAMTRSEHEESLDGFCASIARLAELEGRDGISRIMNSYIKNRFRTKDDFLRQSATALREFGGDQWREVVTLLLGLVLNRETWIQIHAMQVLKSIFQQRDRSSKQALASEHLMPLLRLVESELAEQALDVLEEPMTITGGPTAKRVLRMSMMNAPMPESAEIGDIFGTPEESGWSVPRANARRQECRSRMQAVFDMCHISTRPSMIEFEPEARQLAFVDSMHEDLGGLVQDLHELSEFFQNAKPTGRGTIPSQQLQARVASIMARTNSGEDDNIPQTPFGDVFELAPPSDSDDSETDDSASDSEFDAFIFDKPSLYCSAPNGTKLH